MADPKGFTSLKAFVDSVQSAKYSALSGKSLKTKWLTKTLWRR